MPYLDGVEIGGIEYELRDTSPDSFALAAFPTETVKNAIASFTDGADGIPVKSLIANIEPVQNLNGQSSPYPPGGGKNKLPSPTADSTITSKGLTFKNVGGEYSISGTKNDSGAASASFSLSTPLTISSGKLALNNPQANSNIQFAIYNGSTQSAYWSLNAANRVITISQSFTFDKIVITVTSSVTSGTAVSCSLSPVIVASDETDTTYHPYSNICPISGWNGGEVYGTRVNVWDEEWEVGGINWNTGANSESTTRIRSKNYIPIKGSESYYYLGGKVDIFYYDQNKQLLGKNYYSGSTILIQPQNTYFIRFSLNAEYGTTYNHDISINYPSTDHDYHAYNGNTYPITWQTEAGTVYKGYINPITGVLTVNGMAYTPTDYSGSGGYLQGTISTEGHVTLNGTKADASKFAESLCDAFKYGTYGDVVRYGLATGDTYVRFYFRLPGQLTQAEWRTQMAALAPTVVFYLATPLTYQLTPIEVSTVLGQNNIWANCGSVDVEYRADTKLYINKMIANALNA